jgi:hypothetical protein
MDTEKRLNVFSSSLRFTDDRIGAAAVYCSDGRFGEAFDDFCQNGLKLPRYDRLAVPGGAACLAGHVSSFREEEALIEQLRFLIRVHGIERVVLIAHQDCAFYPERLRISPWQIESRQREDLSAAARRVRSLSHDLVVETFFARKEADGTIRFEAME